MLPFDTRRTLRIASRRSGGFRLITRSTSRVRLAHMCFLLSNSVRWPFLAETACCTRHAYGVGYCGARGLCPLAGLAYFVNNAHCNLKLGLIIGRSLGSETSRAASSALGVRGRITRCLCPFPREAVLVSCAHQLKVNKITFMKMATRE